MIGIGGISRSGKSSLAQRLVDQAGDRKCLILGLDEFVFTESAIPKIKGETDWERPESTDFHKVIQTIQLHQDEHDLIIVEGIHAFTDEQLLSCYDTTVYLKLSKATFLKRRGKETRWGKEADWYPVHVWESHQKYGLYPKADYVLSGELPIKEKTILEILEMQN
ncbi:MAG: hypothetical protein Tsb0034_22940 [Ekhidna sp.]